jgi:hypothetical protein
MKKGLKPKMRMRGGGGGGGGGSGAPHAPLMRGGATADDTCPAGTFCLSNNLIFFGLATIIIILLLIVALRDTGRSNTPTTYAAPPRRPAPTQFLAPPAPAPPIVIQNNNDDDRYMRSPQPLRSYFNGPEFPPRGGLASIPINIPTQGLPERFQSVGIMTLPDGQVLPLYGRRTATSTDRWNYYTRTDTFNPVPVPVSYNKRDCMDDVGCNELMTGEQISTFGTGNAGKVHIYRMDGPKYIPGIL